ncbi:hypothetical protein NTGBS_410025 [Candidatus Nitrotoga sp. BS]|nr:hypothetical protein NTGBS_410025 [Candidatus Nitrotoga sp. BS]
MTKNSEDGKRELQGLEHNIEN